MLSILQGSTFLWCPLDISEWPQFEVPSALNWWKCLILAPFKLISTNWNIKNDGSITQLTFLLSFSLASSHPPWFSSKQLCHYDYHFHCHIIQSKRLNQRANCGKKNLQGIKLMILLVTKKLFVCRVIFSLHSSWSYKALDYKTQHSLYNRVWHDEHISMHANILDMDIIEKQRGLN